MKIYVPSLVLAPFFITAPKGGFVFLSDSHDKRGYCQAGKLLTEYFKTLSTDVLVGLGGDVFRDTHQEHLFGFGTSWLLEETQWMVALADFIDRGGSVFLMPGNHNADLAAYMVLRHEEEAYLGDVPHHEREFDARGMLPKHRHLLKQIRLVPSLVIKHQGKTYLLDHGHRFDWFVPNVVGRLERWIAKLGLLKQPNPETYGSRKNYGRGKFLVNVLGQVQAYARWAKSLGADEVFIGHWHCAGEVRHSQGISVRVASCLTNGQDVVTRVTPDGEVITFRLQDCE